MDVKFDNEFTLSLEDTPANTIALVAAIDAHLKKRGRIAKSITINGQDIVPEDAEEIEAAPLPEPAVVEVTSEAVIDYANRLLAELEEVLPDLPNACHALAAVFQGNAPAEGFEPFERLASIWSVVKTRELDVADAIECSLEDIRIEGMSVLRMHDELNRFLEEAVEALQANDCVLLGDLLEYELAPRARQEAAIIAALRQRIAQPAS